MKLAPTTLTLLAILTTLAGCATPEYFRPSSPSSIPLKVIDPSLSGTAVITPDKDLSAERRKWTSDGILIEETKIDASRTHVVNAITGGVTQIERGRADNFNLVLAQVVSSVSQLGRELVTIKGRLDELALARLQRTNEIAPPLSQQDRIRGTADAIRELKAALQE